MELNFKKLNEARLQEIGDACVNIILEELYSEKDVVTTVEILTKLGKVVDTVEELAMVATTLGRTMYQLQEKQRQVSEVLDDLFKESNPN